MNKSTNNSTQHSTPHSGGRGAKKYISPRIEWIQLDNEISLALESYPAIGPEETLSHITTNPTNPFGLNSI